MIPSSRNSKPSDISDATIVTETLETPTPQTDKANTRAVEPETLKPIADGQAASDGLGASSGSIKDRMKQAAAAAAVGAAQQAVFNAVNNLGRPRPNWAFATQSSAHLIALGFGSGLMRPAPGTWGTVFGWVTFNYFLAGLSSQSQGVIIALAFAIGVWACGAAGRALGVIDHGAWVWDEVVAFWLVLWLVPTSFAAQAWAFVLFRLFDIVKPPPIRQFDAQLKNGFGVMWDDIVAAAYTVLVVALWIKLFG